MSKSSPFKWRHYEASIILRCVRWYCAYPLSYRQLAKMVNERGMEVSHTTIFRWVQWYALELDKRCRPYLHATNDSWRVDETYIEVKGKPKYLYRAVDELKGKEKLSEQVELRQNKYLNNIVEQDHRGIKRLVKPGMGFGSFNTARRTIKGYEMMSMIRKERIKGVAKGAVNDRVKFIAKIFGVAA